jgi:hypothetical protein
MGQKKPPGPITREGTWHIEKQVRGRRMRESCGTGELQAAEHYLIRQIGSDHLGEEVGAIGQMLSSMAVFITLGYLAVQVRQARDAVRSPAVRYIDDLLAQPS